MALINCPECNSEISNKAKNCPHCGYPLIKELESIDDVKQPQNIKSNEGKNKNTYIALLLILLISVITGIYLNYDHEKKVMEEQIKIETQYRENLKLILEDMENIFSESQGKLELLLLIGYNFENRIRDEATDKYWIVDGKEIHDAKIAYENFVSDDKNSDSTKRIVESTSIVRDKISELKSPPENYIKTHNNLLELYEVTRLFSVFAIFPEGNYETITEKIEEYSREFTRFYNEINGSVTR